MTEWTLVHNNIVTWQAGLLVSLIIQSECSIQWQTKMGKMYTRRDEMISILPLTQHPAHNYTAMDTYLSCTEPLS